MPEISRFYGIIVFMFYEDHNPPHIHVKYQEYKAIIELKNGIIKGKMPRIALKLIFQWIDLHRDEIMSSLRKVPFSSKSRLKKFLARS